jgi:hypothetical protein
MIFNQAIIQSILSPVAVRFIPQVGSHLLGLEPLMFAVDMILISISAEGKFSIIDL